MTERVTGVGSVFFRARRPQELASWYAEHLGLAVEEWNGAVLRKEWFKHAQLRSGASRAAPGSRSGTRA